MTKQKPANNLIVKVVYEPTSDSAERLSRVLRLLMLQSGEAMNADKKEVRTDK